MVLLFSVQANQAIVVQGNRLCGSEAIFYSGEDGGFLYWRHAASRICRYARAFGKFGKKRGPLCLWMTFVKAFQFAPTWSRISAYCSSETIPFSTSSCGAR